MAEGLIAQAWIAQAWPWMTVAALGAFHGLNPAMGWLFAVGLALHRGSARPILWALPSIATGHAVSVALVIGAVLAVDVLIEPPAVRVVAGVVLLAWAAFHATYGRRHRVRVGFQAGVAGLAAWSFLMATAHGAGLMLVPALTPLCLSGPGAAGLAGPAEGWTALAVLALHTGAMLAVTGAVAVVIYRWIGLAILRSAWVNLDALWTVMLAGIGGVLILSG